MKKLTVLSIVAASLLLVGCGESATGAEAKAATEAKVETHAEKAATEAKEAASTAVEKTKEAVSEKATEVKEAVAEKAEEAKEAVTGAATAAADKAKEAASAVAEKATEAKEAATEKVEDAKKAVAEATGGDDAGKGLYAKCAGCHGADGKTSALGKSAIIAGQAAADLETKIKGYKAGTLNSAGMGALMKGQVAGLSDDDIKAVAAYISGLK